MNPIFQTAQQTMLNSLQGVKNPQEQVRQIVANMSPAQREHFKTMLPLAKRLAGNYGIDLNNQLAELQFK